MMLKSPYAKIQAGILLLLSGTWCMLMAGALINSALLWLGMGIQAVGCGWTFQGSMKLTGSMAPVFRLRMVTQAMER